MKEKRGGLLYFRGCFVGRVKVACTLLYSIFKVGRGLLYFSGVFLGEIFGVKKGGIWRIERLCYCW